MSIRIAVDAMGGDDAPDSVVEGVVRAVRESDERLRILLVGKEDELRERYEVLSSDLPIEIVHAPQVIGMDEPPAVAVKRKPESSIHTGLALHASGRANAFVSAGNTGAVMAASLFILGRVSGVQRPTLIGYYPTVRGTCIVLDVGANVDCKPEHLLQFAEMGSVYAKWFLQRPDPTVALLNIGEEPGKGNELSKDAYPLLEKSRTVRFLGNIEGRDIMQHAADVVVCDGFVGNIILKLGESVASVLPRLISDEMKRQEISERDQQMIARVVGGVRSAFDYEEYGGTPLLGINGTVMIGHGGSSPRAIRQLVMVAAQMAEANLSGSIAEALGTH
jgi:glycerol-3-phosphate acyltransferase PlsX